MNDLTRIEISFRGYKWVAQEQPDREYFVVEEFQNGVNLNPGKRNRIHEDILDEEIEKVLEASVG